MKNDDDYDYEGLRREVLDYYGTASMYYPQAMMEAEEARRADNAKILEIAKRIGVNVQKYRNFER